MHTSCKNGFCLLVEFEDGFDSKEMMDLIRHEAFCDSSSSKHAIWNVGSQVARFSMGELPVLVDGAAQLPAERMMDSKTAIVADHRPTRMLMQMLADGLQDRLPIRCRTFGSVDEAKRWFEYIGS